jgi:Protein of unknown function (DUF3570)
VAAAVTNTPIRLVVLRLVFLVLATISTWAPNASSAAPDETGAPKVKGRAKAKSHDKTKNRGSPSSFARHHEVKPEEVYLEEDTPTEPTTDTQAESDKGSSASDGASPAAPARGGPAAHVSLETTGYMDSDHVNVISPSITGGLADDVAGWSVNGHYLVDVVSAASVDIVSTASPHWTEVRHAGSLTGSITIDPITVGGLAVISREPDYLSITGGGTLGFDLMQKNVSPYFAFSHEVDSVGRTDLPHEYWKSKQVTSVQGGLTLVLSRSSIGSLQWDGSFERGYLAKPYRYVPLFAPGQGSSVGPGASIDLVNQLRLNVRTSEQLPTARDRYAISGHLAHRFASSTLRLDERLYVDSWGLLASTSELRYIIDAGRRLELWPHFRYHVQSAVSFWERAYEAVRAPDGTLGVPVLRTGDRELSPLQTIVLGAGSRIVLAEPPGTEWDLVLEIDVGQTHFSDALYITERRMGYSTVAIEARF